MTDRPCHACRGQRLKPESLAVTVDDKSIADVANMSVREASAASSPTSQARRDKPTPMLSAKSRSSPARYSRRSAPGSAS